MLHNSSLQPILQPDLLQETEQEEGAQGVRGADHRSMNGGTLQSILELFDPFMFSSPDLHRRLIATQHGPFHFPPRHPLPHPPQVWTA